MVGMPSAEHLPPPPEVTALVAQLATNAAAYLADQPDAQIAGVIHERGTLEWKQVRMMIEQATAQERTDHWISALLDWPSVLDLLGRGGGQEAVDKLNSMLAQSGRWLPVIAIPRAGPFWTMAVEIPPL